MRHTELSGYVWWLAELDNEMKRQLELKDKPREEHNGRQAN